MSEYTQKEYDVLLKEYPLKGAIAIANTLKDRTVLSIDQHAKKLGIQPNVPMKESEREILQKYGRNLGDAVAFLLPNRTLSEIHQMMKAL